MKNTKIHIKMLCTVHVQYTGSICTCVKNKKLYSGYVQIYRNYHFLKNVYNI